MNERPQSGGRYYRQPDGSLLSEREALQQPTEPQPVEPDMSEDIEEEADEKPE